MASAARVSMAPRFQKCCMVVVCVSCYAFISYKQLCRLVFDCLLCNLSISVYLRFWYICTLREFESKESTQNLRQLSSSLLPIAIFMACYSCSPMGSTVWLLVCFVTAYFLRVQNPNRPAGHRRAQEWSLYHWSPQIRWPVRCIPCQVEETPSNFSYRFLNIRLDNIKVLDEARHPHMVSLSFCFAGETHRSIDGSEELFHSWIRSPLCSTSFRARRHATSRRCNT